LAAVEDKPGRGPPVAGVPPGDDAGGPGETDSAAGLSFPDVPRLELDQLLGQLIERADDVLAAQGRLRGLLRANAAVAADLSLPVVLRRIVDAARELLGARYAALGVIGRDGLLEQFVHAGMGGDLVAEIGELPSGRGILGLLISEPVPIRLADLAAHPASAGFPGGHPPMTAFLGVPVRAGEDVFGNLYLTEPAHGGEFTAEDEELAIALAAAAGGAIANARRFTESEQRRQWLAATSELTALLLSGDASQHHELIAEHAVVAAGADFAVLAVPDGTGQATVTAATGLTACGLAGQVMPLDHSLAGRAILTGKPFLVTDYRREEAAGDGLGSEAGPLMIVPLAAGEDVLGALVVGRLAGRPGFTDASLEMAASFAVHAAVSVELAQARTYQITAARTEDHDRIAGDLHDSVIQELFALGMGLQSLAGRIGMPVYARQLSDYTDTIDKVIRKIRDSIFQLQARERSPAGLREGMVELVGEHAPQLGFTASIAFAGSLDSGTSGALAHDILAVTREALSNCARHADATAVGISVALEDGVITLEVTDNGRGIGTPARSSGLTSLRHRAERNGGALKLTTPPGGGTCLTWTARLRP
jgi:two-component system, NarL family, sensor histidine kinase DevS